MYPRGIRSDRTVCGPIRSGHPACSASLRRTPPGADSRRHQRFQPIMNSSNAKGLRYVLVTPARNEEDFIELTLQSVVAQTMLPVRWLIVSDGSTDRTEEIVQRYSDEHKWIELVKRPVRKERHFGGKVDCFNTGYARLEGLDYDIVGSLDGDLSFVPQYFEFLMARFAENPKL